MIETVFNHPLVTATIAGLLLVGVIGKLARASFEAIAKWYLYISAFSVVIVMNSMFFPFIGGKDFFLRFTVELALAAMVLYWAFEARPGEVKRRIAALFKSKLVIAVSVFVLVYVLASLFAYDFHAAFWSNYERGEGGFQMIHYYIFFLLLGMLFTEEKEWRKLFGCFLVAAALMILYGIGGNFGVAGFIGPYSGSGALPSGFWHILTDGRFEGSLGNPAYVAPYLIFSMFYAAYLWLAWRRTGDGAKKKVAPWLYGIAIALFLFFFVISQTRGAFLGLGAGIIVLLAYLTIVARGKSRTVGAALLGLFVILGIAGYAVRNSPTVQSIPAGRLLQISTSDTTAQTRFWVWGEAVKGFLERPVLGWGPENFTPVFDKFFDTRFYVLSEQTETWFDRAHSVYFDYLVETGALGLSSYLAIFIVFCWLFIKKWAKGASRTEQGLMIALPVAYLVQGIAIFDVLPMYINLFFFLAFASYYFYKKQA